MFCATVNSNRIKESEKKTKEKKKRSLFCVTDSVIYYDGEITSSPFLLLYFSKEERKKTANITDKR